MMTRIPLAFFLAAPAFAFMAQGANAAFLSPATGALTPGSSLVLQTHGCHKLCARGPYDSPSRHRHQFGSCAPTHFPCIDWGTWWSREPIFYKRRHPH